MRKSLSIIFVALLWSVGAWAQGPKYVILLIGDGMGLPQIAATEAAADIHLHTRGFPVVGLATTCAADRLTTCSAAAATALATGHKTSINTIGLSADRADTLRTIAEIAHARGMRVGIVSSASIDHATPAGFYAHVADRNMFEQIGNQLLNSGFDYFAGGSPRWDMRKTLKTAAEFRTAAATKGYKFIDTRAGLDALGSGDGKVIATLNMLGECGYTGGESAMPYSIDSPLLAEEDRTSLADFTRKGLELLECEAGFFMMVEGGKIDWACHANDAAAMIGEVLAFDEAVVVALDFYARHPDETLVIVTADHETGGLTLGRGDRGYDTDMGLLMGQKVSGAEYASRALPVWREQRPPINFAEAMGNVAEWFGIAEDRLTGRERDELEKAFSMSMTGDYASYEDPFTAAVMRTLARRAGIGWASGVHTALPAPVFATGNGAHNFAGYMDNTDIPKRIISTAMPHRHDHGEEFALGLGREAYCGGLTVRFDDAIHETAILERGGPEVSGTVYHLTLSDRNRRDEVSFTSYEFDEKGRHGFEWGPFEVKVTGCSENALTMTVDTGIR